MYIRRLKKKDAPLMLLWMHDEDVTKFLNKDFSLKTLEDAENFISDSFKDKNINYAIVSDKDEYMGTVSLKNIEYNRAEIGIVVRAEAMGRGYAWYGMKSIINIAFNELMLNNVYWCVSNSNVRAVRFYNKHHFHETFDIPEDVLVRYKGNDNLKWYSVMNGDDFNVQDMVSGCKVVHIKTIPTLNVGELSVFESFRDVPFEIKRLYYITKVPEGGRRGFHAHKTNLRQLLFCPYGKIKLILENRHGREEIELSDPSIGVVIEECTWREMLWLQKDSVLCVAASEFYDDDDYIRDYNEFKSYINSNKYIG